jgi:hypothetical protein
MLPDLDGARSDPHHLALTVFRTAWARTVDGASSSPITMLILQHAQ